MVGFSYSMVRLRKGGWLVKLLDDWVAGGEYGWFSFFMVGLQGVRMFGLVTLCLGCREEDG